VVDHRFGRHQRRSAQYKPSGGKVATGGRWYRLDARSGPDAAPKSLCTRVDRSTLGPRPEGVARSHATESTMPVKSTKNRGKILAVASSGGHWVQLRRLVPAFANFEVVYVTVLKSYRSQVPESRFYLVNDATRWNKLRLVILAIQLAWIVGKERPDVIVSTGAAPGYFALLFGRLFGARTIWIDSIANIEHLSMSGSHVGRYADLWLTQWKHLAKSEGPHYGGSVL